MFSSRRKAVVEKRAKQIARMVLVIIDGLQTKTYEQFVAIFSNPGNVPSTQQPEARPGAAPEDRPARCQRRDAVCNRQSAWDRPAYRRKVRRLGNQRCNQNALSSKSAAIWRATKVLPLGVTMHDWGQINVQLAGRASRTQSKVIGAPDQGSACDLSARCARARTWSAVHTPTPRLAIDSYWRAHAIRADRLARVLAARSGAPKGWTWRLGHNRKSGLPTTFRTPPAPYRERTYARGAGPCCVCGQPVYRYHISEWELCCASRQKSTADVL
jgi:hypothetical protein